MYELIVMGAARTTDVIGGRPPDARSQIYGFRIDDGRLLSIEVGKPLVIGRDDGCSIKFADPEVSKRHAQVEIREGDPYTVHVQDLGSQNGTIVEGCRVNSVGFVARAGDEICISRKRMLVVDKAMARHVRSLSIAFGYSPSRLDNANRVLSAGARGRHLIVAGPLDRRVARVVTAFHGASTRHLRELHIFDERHDTSHLTSETIANMRGCTVFISGLEAAKSLTPTMLDELASGYHIGVVAGVATSSDLDALRRIWGDRLQHHDAVRLDDIHTRATEFSSLLDDTFAEMSTDPSSMMCIAPKGELRRGVRELGKDVVDRILRREWDKDYNRLEGHLHFLFHRLEAGATERGTATQLERESSSQPPLGLPGVAVVPRTTFADWAHNRGIDFAPRALDRRRGGRQ